MATEKQLKELVINKVDSQTTYNAMKNAGNINADELYFIAGDEIATSDAPGLIKSGGDIEISDTGIVTVVSGANHNHDNRYYTESEIDGKITSINNSISGKTDNTTTANLQSQVDSIKSQVSDIQNDIDSYDLPLANGTTKGAVITGGDVSVTNGVITVTSGANHEHNIEDIENLNSTLAAKYDKSSGNALEANVATMQSKLDSIENNANNYTLPTATSTTLGGVMASSSISVDSTTGKATVVNNSHSHTIANIANLQDTLNAKYSASEGSALSTSVDSIKNEITTINATLEKKLEEDDLPSIDNALSSTSEHAVQNKVVNQAITSLNSSVTTLNNNYTSQQTVIDNLPNKYATIDSLSSTKSELETKISTASSTAASNLTTHNSSGSAHQDIRNLISSLETSTDNDLKALADRLETVEFFFSDEEATENNLDQLHEIITYIQTNRDILEEKLSKTDVINNVTSEDTDKPLAANQGKVLKTLIDALQSQIDGTNANISNLKYYSSINGHSATVGADSYTISNSDPITIDKSTSKTTKIGVKTATGTQLGVVKLYDSADSSKTASSSYAATPAAVQTVASSVTTNQDTYKKHTHTVTHTPGGTISSASVLPTGTVTSTFTGTKTTALTHTFAGTQATISSSYTPAGAVQNKSITPAGTVAITTAVVGSGETATYTPTGSVNSSFSGNSASHSHTVTLAGTANATTSNETVNVVTSVGTLPTLNASITNKCMTFAWSAGTLPSTTSKSVSLSTHTHSVELSGATDSTNLTPTGTVSSTFTGTGRMFNAAFTGTAASHNHDFIGTPGTATATYKPEGTIAAHTYTPTGTVTSAFAGDSASHSHTFTGTEATLTTSTPASN